MIEKKKSGISLEKNRTAFFSAGLILVSALVLTAFEWKSLSIQEQFASRVDGDEAHMIEEEIIRELLVPPKPQVPKPPRPQHPKMSTNIIIDDRVENIENIENIKSTKTDDPIDIDIEIGTGDPGPRVEKLGKEWSTVEQMPEFPGGYAAMQKFIQDNVVYPPMAREFGEQGTTYIEFTIEVDGSITRSESKRAFDYGIDEEALRVVKLMPKWKAGEQRGRKVRVRFTIPIKFSLSKN